MGLSLRQRTRRSGAPAVRAQRPLKPPESSWEWGSFPQELREGHTVRERSTAADVSHPCVTV